ncbi:MAG TPA: hypothetical protein VEO96_08715 [Thermoplasmata archaeon]|nr:hypothetical protein [Thermoplasmata archaeon]
MAAKWEPAEKGANQLEQLNSMERQQDVNLWTSSAIFATASSVLLVAWFSMTDPTLPKVVVPLAGFVLAVVWMLISIRAHQYEGHWVRKAQDLEDEMDIPQKFRVWDRKGLPGIPGKFAEYLLILFFGSLWVALGGLSLGFSFGLELVLIGLGSSLFGAVTIVWPILWLRKSEVAKMKVDPLHMALVLEDELMKQRRFAGLGVLLLVLGTSLEFIGAFV